MSLYIYTYQQKDFTSIFFHFFKKNFISVQKTRNRGKMNMPRSGEKSGIGGQPFLRT